MQPGKVGDTQDDRTGIIMRPMMVGWEVTATKERERERERETNIQIGLLGQEFLRRKAATDRNNNNNKKREKKRSEGGPQTEVHHYEAEMGFFFPSLYNAWHLHSRRSDMPVGTT